MQSMDRNTVIGFVLLAVLLMAYLFVSTKNSHELEAQKKRYDDSVARVIAMKQAEIAKKDSATHIAVVSKDTTTWGKIVNGEEKTLTVENGALKIVFTNKGGQPKSVQLLHYKTAGGKDLVEMENSSTDKLSYGINTPNGQSAQTADLFFDEGTLVKNANGSQVVTFRLPAANGETIIHQYTILPDNYLIDWNVQLTGTDKLLTQNAFNLQWQTRAMHHEKDAEYERRQSQIVFLQEGGYDYYNIYSRSDKQFEKPLQWVSVKQQFFNSTLIAKDKFDGGQMQWTRNSGDTTGLITQASASFNKKLPAGSVANLPMQLYYGPNDYHLLRNSGVESMDKIINLGQGIYSFVRPINQFIILPVFGFLKNSIVSFGLVIALLTIFIRLLTSPLMYPGYLTSAKMKILKPELAELRKKFPDQQQFAMEQMKFTREAGVNTFAGCLPSLFQIPIFFALYSFFNSNIDLRGQSFLWADDLSAYDHVINFGVSIPLLGDHLSMFTITAVLTSFLISLYGSMNMTPDQNNPALKYMPYIFPFILLFVFNKLPAALTWYYTVSNIITLCLQFVIQHYIINHDKLIAQIEMNRKKPKTKSKWQERMEQMQETQKRLQEQKNKQQKR